MERLKRLIVGSEDEFVRRVLWYARTYGYSQHMPALEEAYRMAVASMSAGMIQSLNLAGDIRDVRASDDLEIDPIAQLGSRMGRQRRGDAADVRVILGLLKYFRRAYLDVINDAGLQREEERRYATVVDRFFDRYELGCVSQWCADPADVIDRAILERNQQLALEKNRYLGAFADLPIPAMFLDAQDNVENMNVAAVLLFKIGESGRTHYYYDASRREGPPVLAEEIASFRSGLEREISFERELRTAKGTRFFQIRFNKVYDVDDEYAGMLITLNDLTYRRHAEEALRRSQAKYLTLFENMLTGFAYTQVVLDRRNRPIDYTFVEVNAAFERMTGLRAVDIVGRRMTEVMPGARNEVTGSGDWLGTLGRVAVTGETASFDSYLDPPGRWYSSSVYSPASGFVTVMLTDISELKWIQESLSRSRDFYLTLFEGFPSLIWRAGSDGQVDYVNRSWLDFTGRELDQVTGEHWLDDVHTEDRERRSAAMREAVERHRSFQIEYRLRAASGEYRWVLENGRPFRDLDGSFAGVIGSAADIMDRKQQEVALEHLATHDQLTGLPNRRLFEEALARAVAHARRGHPSALLFIDLDGFKAINDSFGHAAGDAALKTVSDMLVKHLRTEDLVARVGGDEFAVLMQDTVLSDGRRASERLRLGVHASSIGPSGDPVSLSIGLVEVDGQTDAPTTLGHADTAMYRAKEKGGNRVSIYQPGFEADAGAEGDERTGLMLARLKDALSRDGAFIFNYQPVFRVSDGAVLYSEALIRLIDRDRNVIQPRDFVAVAERFGLMPQLSRWVLRQAALVLRDNPDVTLSVNLSGVDLADSGLLDAGRAMLADSGVSADRLGFELSETAVLADLEGARRWIENAREHGFKFSLDDFGGGYNSFSYLRNLPVDRIKIDGSVIRSLVIDPRQLTLLEAVQSVASSGGMETVAECVENEYVLRIVRDVGVDLAQGFHLGRPSLDIITASEMPWESRFPGGRATGEANASHGE